MSHADADQTLLEVLRTIALEQHYQHPQLDYRPITSGGANYTSKLYLATISSKDKTDLKLFAKIGCISDKIRNQVNADRLFRTEHLIYTKLVKDWDSLQEKHRVPQEHRYLFPKYYGGHLNTGSETVVLEDLVAAGFGVYNRFKSVDWEHASESIESLAKYHALSFVLEKEDPEEYAKCAEQLQFEAMPHDDSLDAIWKQMVGGAVAVLEDELKERANKYFDKIDQRKAYIDFNSPRRKPVLVHGDYRTSNLLFRRQNDKLQAMPIDYQTVHTGCPVSDFIYFVVTGTDEEFRRDHYQRLVSHYHQTLGQALRRYQLDVEEVYPFEEFQNDLKEQMMQSALLLAVMLLPVVMVEAENAPRIDTADGIDSFIVKPNQLFAERLGGLVRDLIRWDVI